MKRRIFFLLLIFFGAIFFIIGIYSYTNNSIHHRNSFIRLFPSHLRSEPNIIDIIYNSYYIAGLTSAKAYLGNETNPARLLISGLSLIDTQYTRILDVDKMPIISGHLTVDPPNLYIADPFKHQFFMGNLTNLVVKRYLPDSTAFVDAIPISNTSLAIKKVNLRNREYIFAKETMSPPYFNISPNILQKQQDGLFSTDGMFLFNRDLGFLVYVYYYRNQFICLDTNLTLQYTGKTIDTNTYAKIKIGSIKSNHTTIMAAPPLTVNRLSCTDGNWLFINSTLLAKNENKELFEKGSVIDIYNLKTGLYRFSFYLFNFRNKKVTDFKVHKTTLIAVYDHFLLSYQLNPQYFK